MIKSVLKKMVVLTTSLLVMTPVVVSSAQATTTSSVMAITDNEAIVELRHKLQQMKQFSANFQQQVFDAKGQEIQQATGSMKVQQPNKFRWVTNEPDESLIVSDGEAVWIYNPFVEQVTAMSLDQTVQQSPLWLIANQSENAWQQFSVARSAKGYIIMPHDRKNLTRKIEMRFKGGNLSGLFIEDRQGQSSNFVFSDVDESPSLNADTFMFSLPAGVDFDDQREAK
ncbi:outer membrane lipoprotein chaperone LolA [Psychrobium sp. 1_MG-2023]|uniref:outer membrane lipoprotein chaperone LolA n=1 Tax=Psychrobium sp. 1_MG-2023 TaxID=3062624 RepID=UPI0026A4FED6|nr:outer membrane lipoprotein chaperone LolA [Psychrobium sp. 1_MG-2023]MDP2561866.1 outer membrane lipoprotein chaperone LolA [Psychrobium sp. 1_MG-2023]